MTTDFANWYSGANAVQPDRAYCRMAGQEVVELIQEEGVSASIPLGKRPDGAKLLELMNGGISHVVSLKLYRLFRDAEDALRQTKAWDNAGVSWHLVDMGGQFLSTSSAMGRMFLTLMDPGDFEESDGNERERVQ